jgi:uncharacterized damage-inducible protein DinB
LEIHYLSPELVRTLFAYDQWANSRTFDACSTLSHEEFLRNMGSSFPSVRDTLAHMIGAQWVWLERFHGRIPPGLPKPQEFPDFSVLRERAGEIQHELNHYIARISAEDLASPFEYRDLKGNSHRNYRWQVLQHLANHGTYHRGQITTLLRQLGAKPISTDMIGFYRERAAASGQ